MVFKSKVSRPAKELEQPASKPVLPDERKAEVQRRVQHSSGSTGLDWLLISVKHGLGVLQKPAIANIVYLDIPNERLTALEPRSRTPSTLAPERSRSTAPAS